jgi:hypothetical protein
MGEMDQAIARTTMTAAKKTAITATTLLKVDMETSRAMATLQIAVSAIRMAPAAIAMIKTRTLRLEILQATVLRWFVWKPHFGKTTVVESLHPISVVALRSWI